jgi:hypothetical protein
MGDPKRLRPVMWITCSQSSCIAWRLVHLSPESGREVDHRLLRIHADGSDLAVGSRERRSQIDTSDRLVIVRPKMPAQIF